MEKKKTISGLLVLVKIPLKCLSKIAQNGLFRFGRGTEKSSASSETIILKCLRSFMKSTAEGVFWVKKHYILYEGVHEQRRQTRGSEFTKCIRTFNVCPHVRMEEIGICLCSQKLAKSCLNK